MGLLIVKICVEPGYRYLFRTVSKEKLASPSAL